MFTIIMPKTVGGNPSGTIIKELELPNTFYAGPSIGNKDIPLFRNLTVHDINQAMADGVGSKMSYIGSNSVATNMTTTGGNAIANKIDTNGANVIAANMGTTGAYTIGQKLQVSTSDGVKPLSYTQLAQLVNNNTTNMGHAKEALIALEAFNIIQNTMWFVLNASSIAAQVSTAIVTFGVSGLIASAQVLFTGGIIGLTVAKIAAIGASINKITHEAQREDLTHVTKVLDNLVIDSGTAPNANVQPNVVFAGPPFASEVPQKAGLRYLVNADIPTNATEVFITNLTQPLTMNAYTTVKFTGKDHSIYSTRIGHADGVFTNTTNVGIFLTVSFTTFFANNENGVIRAHRLKCGNNYYGNQQCLIQYGEYVGISSSCRIHVVSGGVFTIEAYTDSTNSFTYSNSTASSTVYITAH